MQYLINDRIHGYRSTFPQADGLNDAFIDITAFYHAVKKEQRSPQSRRTPALYHTADEGIVMGKLFLHPFDVVIQIGGELERRQVQCKTSLMVFKLPEGVERQNHHINRIFISVLDCDATPSVTAEP